MVKVVAMYMYKNTGEALKGLPVHVYHHNEKVICYQLELEKALMTTEAFSHNISKVFFLLFRLKLL